ncbi:MAG TPA: hypothetical protein VD994_14575 [Prosthecobacter sp.]|nr:hypothetical protein [Prosthecobacter sp.]
MRLFFPLIALAACLMAQRESHAQAPPKARAWTDCDSVCLSLTDAIASRPETLEMRLEDALVIRRECAGEIVAAALNAVGPNRAMRQLIVNTALKVAPEKSSSILYAARNPTRSAPVPEVDEEKLFAAAVVVKKAVIPEEEIRRAEIPAIGAMNIAAAPAPAPESVPEVRRAIPVSAPSPAVEVRRAELPRLHLSQRRRR